MIMRQTEIEDEEFSDISFFVKEMRSSNEQFHLYGKSHYLQGHQWGVSALYPKRNKKKLPNLYGKGVNFGLAACYFRLSTIVAVRLLNFCVRNGYRCGQSAITTRPLDLQKPETNS